MTEKTPGQVAYEARQVAKGRRMGADDDTPDSEILAVIGLGWNELPAGMQADEEAGALAVLDSFAFAQDGPADSGPHADEVADAAEERYIARGDAEDDL